MTSKQKKEKKKSLFFEPLPKEKKLNKNKFKNFSSYVFQERLRRTNELDLFSSKMKEWKKHMD